MREAGEVETLKAAREHTDRQEEVGTTRYPALAIGREPPGRQDTMQVGMMMQLLAPGMQHREAPNLRAEMLGVSSDILERLRHGTKE